MVHKFKFGVHRFLYDSESGYTHAVDELGFKMIDYIELPMAKDCPSSLRYDLAKYDSDAISAVYAELRGLYEEGKLFAPEKPVSADAVRISGDSGKGAAHVADTKDGVIVESIAEGEDDVVADIDALSREAKLSLKAGNGTIFAPAKRCEHGFEVCASCHARHLCALSIPGRKACEYERLSLDCELAAKALGQKNNL